MHPLRRLLDRPERVVAGLMSGTSLDGVDAAVVRLAGSGRALRLETLAFGYTPYGDALRDALRDACAVATSDVRRLSQLNARLGHAFADAVEAVLAEAGLAPEALDLV